MIKHVLILPWQSCLNANKMASESRSVESQSLAGLYPFPRAETRVFEHEMDIII